jgi:beta-lactamase regulating signal transducer with metallopeptidase domain
MLSPLIQSTLNIEDRLMRAQLDSAIAHELFHVDRRDNLTAMLHILVEAVCWFHPMVWRVSRHALSALFNANGSQETMDSNSP